MTEDKASEGDTTARFTSAVDTDKASKEDEVGVRCSVLEAITRGTLISKSTVAWELSKSLFKPNSNKMLTIH